MMKLASLWIGDRLGPIEVLSAQSVLASGHEFTIFAYGPIDNVPDGIEVRQAEPIFSGEKVLRYPINGWPSIHSNLFRYQMLARGGYTWVDLDVLVLRPFEFDTDHVFGFEEGGSVNNAVLGLPPGSEVLERLLSFTPDMRGYPPQATPKERRKLWLKSFGRGARLQHWGHGATGPKALTYFLTETGRIADAQPHDVFYPVSWDDHPRLVAPDDLSVEDLPESACAVHLWGSHVRRVMKWKHGGAIPESSFLGQMVQRLGPPQLSRRNPD